MSVYQLKNLDLSLDVFIREWNVWTENSVINFDRVERHDFWSRFLLFLILFFGGKRIDRVERQDFWPRLWLFFAPFFFSPKKEERRKREWIAKIVIKRHTYFYSIRENGKRIPKWWSKFMPFYSIIDFTSFLSINKNPETCYKSQLDFYAFKIR